MLKIKKYDHLKDFKVTLESKSKDVENALENIKRHL